MPKKIIIFLCFLFLLGFGFVQAQPVSLIPIEDSYYKSKFGQYTYPTVYFSHEVHANEYQISCKSCHHIYKNGKNVWTPDEHSKTCAECHNKSKVEAVNAYHMKCWGCHKRIKELYESADTPTTQCNRCHIKEKDLTKEKKRIQVKLEKKDNKLFEIIHNLKVEGFY